MCVLVQENSKVCSISRRVFHSCMFYSPSLCFYKLFLMFWRLISQTLLLKFFASKPNYYITNCRTGAEKMIKEKIPCYLRGPWRPPLGGDEKAGQTPDRETELAAAAACPALSLADRAGI